MINLYVGRGYSGGKLWNYSGGKIFWWQTPLKYLIPPPAHNQLYMCRGKKKKKISSGFNNIIPTLTLPLTLRCLFSFSDVEHSRSGQWSYLPLPAPAVFSGRKAQYLRREFFFSPLRPEHFYQVKSWISSFATRIFYHQNISDFTTRITFFVFYRKKFVIFF